MQCVAKKAHRTRAWAWAARHANQVLPCQEGMLNMVFITDDVIPTSSLHSYELCTLHAEYIR